MTQVDLRPRCLGRATSRGLSGEKARHKIRWAVCGARVPQYRLRCVHRASVRRSGERDNGDPRSRAP